MSPQLFNVTPEDSVTQKSKRQFRQNIVTIQRIEEYKHLYLEQGNLKIQIEQQVKNRYLQKIVLFLKTNSNI